MRRARSYPVPTGEGEKSIRIPGYGDAPDTESAGCWTVIVLLVCAGDIVKNVYRGLPWNWMQWTEVVISSVFLFAFFSFAFRSANEERTITFDEPGDGPPVGDVDDTRIQP